MRHAYGIRLCGARPQGARTPLLPQRLAVSGYVRGLPGRFRRRRECQDERDRAPTAGLVGSRQRRTPEGCQSRPKRLLVVKRRTCVGPPGIRAAQLENSARDLRQLAQRTSTPPNAEVRTPPICQAIEPMLTQCNPVQSSARERHNKITFPIIGFTSGCRELCSARTSQRESWCSTHCPKWLWPLRMQGLKRQLAAGLHLVAS